MKFKQYINEERPTGGRQHTSGALKSFAKRSKKEGERYLNIHNDPKWTKIEGIGVYRVPGSKIAALPANDKKSSQNWIIFNVETREEITSLKKKDLFAWLSKYAVDIEGMK